MTSAVSFQMQNFCRVSDAVLELKFRKMIEGNGKPAKFFFGFRPSRRQLRQQEQRKRSTTGPFPEFIGTGAAENLAERNSPTTKKTTNWSVATFKGKNLSLLICFFSVTFGKPTEKQLITK